VYVGQKVQYAGVGVVDTIVTGLEIVRLDFSGPNPCWPCSQAPTRDPP
jgi:hypothetical protein